VIKIAVVFGALASVLAAVATIFYIFDQRRWPEVRVRDGWLEEPDGVPAYEGHEIMTYGFANGQLLTRDSWGWETRRDAELLAALRASGRI
jgi:hypothetical protein